MLAIMSGKSTQIAALGAIVGVALLAWGMGAERPAHADASAASASAPATSAPATSAPAPEAGDAAKHAKRTACLKEAKTKKLLGADKTAFLKNCIAAP